MDQSDIVIALHAFDFMGWRPPRQSLRELREVFDDNMYVSRGVKCRSYTADDHRAYRKRAERRHRRKWLAKQQLKRMAVR